MTLDPTTHINAPCHGNCFQQIKYVQVRNVEQDPDLIYKTNPILLSLSAAQTHLHIAKAISLLNEW